jgi:methyl-accepting chemotaxis protein
VTPPTKLTAAIAWCRRHLTVRLRLFALLLLAGAMLGGLGQRLREGVERLGGTITTCAETDLPAVVHICEARAAFLRAHLAERSLLFMALGSDQARQTMTAHETAVAATTEAWSAFAVLAPELAFGNRFPDAWTEWCAMTEEVLETLAEDTPEARRDATDLSMGIGKDAAAVVENALDAAAKACITASRERGAEATVTATTQSEEFVRALVVGLATLLVLGFAIVHSVVRPLRRTVRALRECADGHGDLSQRLPIASGEIGALAASFNRFVEGLASIVGAMRKTANQVQQEAGHVALLGDGMATGATAVEQNLGTAGAAARQVLEVTTSAAESTRELSASIQAIAERTQVLTTTVQHVDRDAASTHAVVEAMGRDSVHVQQVIAVIDGIARQTNLLALNASIEAARAGEYGAGFAVVAERVKSLSVESAKATAEIRRRIDAFVTSVQQTVRSITDIKEATHRLGASTSDIAAAVEEQSAVTQQFADSFAMIRDASGRIAGELDDIQGSARATSAGATSARDAADALTSASTRLTELVGNFRT